MLRKFDFYRRIYGGMTGPTKIGAILSIIAIFSIVIVFRMEFKSYLAVDTASSIILSERSDADLLSTEFNISFPALSCNFISIEMINSLGMNRLNITKTINKFSIEPNLKSAGAMFRSDAKGMKHDDEGLITVNPLDFDKDVHQHEIFFVLYFTTWAPTCIKPMASWERAANIIRDKYDLEIDGPIRLAKFDCTENIKFCESQGINAFPSYQSFWKGHIEDYYSGDRDTDSIVSYVEHLVAKAKNRTGAISIGGCRIEGFVDVEHVPVNLIFSSRSAPHSFNPSMKNMSHVISHLTFGQRISFKETHDEKSCTQNMGRNYERMIGHPFIIYPNSSKFNVTFEHHIEIVKTETVRHGHLLVKKYDYTSQSRLWQSNDLPMVKFHIQMSPVKVLVTENGKSFMHFIGIILAFCCTILQVGYFLYLCLNTHKIQSKKRKGKKKPYTA